MTERHARRLVVHGRVQGVGFRYGLCGQAQRLGLAGWVRNRHDGTVEAVVAGPAADVQALVDWARRGPPAARVDRLDLEPAPEPADADGFEMRPTA